MAVSLSALLTNRPLHPGKILVLISVTERVNPRAIMRLEVLGNLTKFNDIGNETLNLLACSVKKT
jgi:hypothetical protein